jgi:Ca-activated chloride channel family protein
MSFLALSNSQMLLLSVATAAAIIGLYLLKPPPKTVVVPSTLLWSRVVKERKSSSDRLRWWLSLLLALGIGLLMTLALGRPEPDGVSGDSRRVAVVVDNSPTMATRGSDGRTRWEHAVDEAHRILAEGSGAVEFLMADTAGQVVAPVFETREVAWTELEALRVAAPGRQSFPQLILDDAKLYFVTDGVMVDPSSVPEEAVVISVFEPARNVGITRFEVQPLPADPTHYEAFLEVLNGGLEASDVNIVVSGSGGKRVQRTVRVSAGDYQGLVFDMQGFSGGAIRAAVTASGDSLDVDNYAYAYLPLSRKLRVVLVTHENPFLESFHHPRFELFKLPPEEFREIPAADIYIMDGFAPDEPPHRPCLYIHPPSTSWLPHGDGEVEAPSVRSWQSEHTLLQSVSLEDLVVGRAQRVEADMAKTLVASAEGPLILADESQRRWLLITFALEDSNFPLLSGFPVFMSNAITWLAGEPAARSRSVGLVDVPGVDARVSTLTGDEVPIHEMRGAGVFEAPGPGFYTAIRGGRKVHIVVNMTDGDVTGVNVTSYPERRERGETLSANEVLRGRWYGELWILLLGLAVGLLTLEWWTYNRRLTT